MILNTTLFTQVWSEIDSSEIFVVFAPIVSLGGQPNFERITKYSAIIFEHNCRNSLNPRCYTFEKSSLTKLDKSLIDRHIGK